ncbi:lytic transglycosylase domain-containing protein [Parvibaculum indicum]|uniref:lytic transglycosylase domain-containing protein n=1 Tax=Parvibaculum indicum TaxID=562969 RepID=UPI001FE53DD5|nr:lytic transglycosylase domain-containing protein [Parvibaculum indicum]
MGRYGRRISSLTCFRLAAACLLPCAALGLAAPAGAAEVPLARPAAGAAATAASAPTPVPAPTAPAGILDAADWSHVARAFDLADDGHWTIFDGEAAAVKNPVARKLLLWDKLVEKDSGAKLADIAAFQNANPDWPLQSLLDRRAEEALLSYSAGAQDTLSWFAAHPPVTGDGKIRYGETLILSGDKERGADWIRRAWTENDFSTARQKEIIAQYGQYLTQDVQMARLARLLWERRSTDARKTAALLGEDAQKLADARIHLASRSSKAENALSRVPPYLRRDPGLIFDQVRYERRKGNDTMALPLLLTAPASPGDMVRPDSWWVERRIAARKALADGLFSQAYKIASEHGLTEGGDFAEAEFLSGWIALQYLNEPAKAAAHFDRLDKGVSTPISKARAKYWLARAAEAGGHADRAKRFYTEASAYPTTFYGQLAIAAEAAQGGDGMLKLANDPTLPQKEKQSFEKRELVQAAKILHQIDRQSTLWTFMLHMADRLNDPAELAALADLARQFGNPKLSIRVAKSAAMRNIVLADRAYPTNLMPSWKPVGPSVEPSLVYGLSRQESEFDADAVSHAGARGLMQLMPSTARLVARQFNLPYSRSRLTDAEYNATLGAAHLGDLVQNEFGGSYIMSIAAYNAGKRRVDQWVDRYGDPRSTAVDPIDWIENIPYSETRNYVQRVMENLEVYRARLDGKEQPIRLGADLRRNTGPAITAPPPERKPDDLPLVRPAPKGHMAPVVEADDR